MSKYLEMTWRWEWTKRSKRVGTRRTLFQSYSSHIPENIFVFSPLSQTRWFENVGRWVFCIKGWPTNRVWLTYWLVSKDWEIPFGNQLHGYHEHAHFYKRLTFQFSMFDYQRVYLDEIQRHRLYCMYINDKQHHFVKTWCFGFQSVTLQLAVSRWSFLTSTWHFGRVKATW